MANKLCFVQFIHPGGEHQPGEDGIKQWNSGPHKRKFLKQRGRYLHDGRVHDGDLMFWGEWEPESRLVTHLEQPCRPFPRYLYEPYIVLPTDQGWLQNTDPFVFGGQFHYTCCQQYARGCPTHLRFLAEGSVILFGSCIARSTFVIDTVFVVDRWIDYAVEDMADIKAQVMATYHHVTLDRVSAQYSYRLYFGATFERPQHGMFSFFPCLAYEGKAIGFARPHITLPGVITDNLYQGKKLNPQPSVNEVVQLWQAVREQVEEQQLMLGVHSEMPERRNPDGSAWIDDRQSNGDVSRGHRC